MSHPFGILSQFGRKFSGVIHVGANNGKEVVEYNKYMIKHAVLIEPLPNVFDQLKKSIIGYDGFTAVQALCSHLPNINYDFYIANNNGQSSSLLKPKRHVVEHPDVEFNSKMEILSTTLDLVMAATEESTNINQAQFDTLVIDVQGAELMVLKGATRTLDHIRFLFTEVSYGGLYENDVIFEELQKFLKCFGFRLFWLCMNNHGWGDALFIKQRNYRSA